MTLHDLVVALRESGTSEHKLTVLRQIAKTMPEGVSLDLLVDEFAKHHNVTEGTVKKAKAILQDAAAAVKAFAATTPPPPAPPSTRK
jgi:hypothetical protein